MSSQLNAGKGKDGKDAMSAMAVIPDFAVEPLVAQTAPTTQTGRRERLIQFGFALLLNLLFLFALFYRVPYTLPPLSEEQEAIEVELVQQDQAPPPPPPPAEKPQKEEQPQPKEEEKPKPEEKVEEKPKEQPPEKYRESGGDPDLEIGNMPDKEAIPDKAESEVKAVKPEPEAPKQPSADLPEWAKSLDRGYDLPEPKTYNTNSPSGRIGQGGGDAYLNQVYAQIRSHLRVPSSAVGRAGTAKVGFVLDRAGNLRSIYLVRSSGMRNFDLEVMDAVRRAAPYRPLPSDFGDNYALELRVSP